MNASMVVFSGINRVEFLSLRIPPLASNHLRIRTLYSGVSGGTEGWVLRNKFTWAYTPYPCVPGYQRVGIIEGVGDGVRGWKVGERVFATRSVWSGPVVPFWGAHSSISDSPIEEVYRIQDTVSDINAANSVVAQVGYNAANRLVLQEVNPWVLVIGDGLIAQSASQAVRARGAKVILVGHRQQRLQLAALHSADVVVNSRLENVTDKVNRIMNGTRVRYILDSIQGEDVQRLIMPVLERGSQIVYCGFTPGKVWADMAALQQQEITIHFVSGWLRQRIEDTLKQMSVGIINIQPLVTHLISPNRAPEMYQMNLDKSQEFLGITFKWD